jgi:soluble lytic murein transglycosylase
MQLLPSTAEGLNKNFNLQPKLDYKSPEDNVKLGTLYLSTLLKQFNEDRNKAIAGYNCGPPRIKCLAEKYGNDWQNHLKEVCIPPGTQIDKPCGSETEEYLVKVNTCMSACLQKGCAIC